MAKYWTDEEELKALNKLISARTELVLSQPFFGLLALRLDPIADPRCPTTATDGKYLYYNPLFVNHIQRDETIGCVTHEVGHAALAHPYRRDAREPMRWNLACDIVVNALVREAGFTLPKGAFEASNCGVKCPACNSLLGSCPQCGSAEQIYNLLPEMKPSLVVVKHGHQNGQGCNGKGCLRDANKETAEADKSDWEIAVIQAAAAGQGSTPASMRRLVDRIKHPPVDWKSALRRFVQMSARLDYDWMRPNSRYAVHGLYLPAMRSEQMPSLVVAVDTSGSICDQTLALFGNEVQSIMDDVRPESVHVIYCDAAIAKVERYYPGEPLVLGGYGGGGTDFRPVFEYVKEKLDDDVCCIVYLTDLFGAFPDEKDVRHPTLWCSISGREHKAPFGETLVMDVNSR